MRAALLLLLLLLAPVLGALQRSESLGAQPYKRPNATSPALAIPLFVSSLTSPNTQLAYSYYHLKFCEPSPLKNDKTNLGDAMLGTTMHSSSYNVSLLQNSGCQVLCRMDPKEDTLMKMKDFVESAYSVNWYLDGLPAVSRLQLAESEDEFVYVEGFPLGFVENKQAYLNNHVDIVIKYTGEEEIQIMAFEIKPDSVAYDKVLPPYTCSSSSSNSRLLIDPTQLSQIVLMTYSVTWENTTLSWDDRFEPYSRSNTQSVNWFSLLNSLLIIVFLAGMIALIMTRILQTECFKNIRLPFDRSDTEEVTWKLLSGDVFRAPIRPILLASLVGNGVQIIVTISVLLLFGWFGYFTPDQGPHDESCNSYTRCYRSYSPKHGSFLTALPVVFAFGGLFGGHVATRAYQHMGDVSIWRTTALTTSLMLPGCVLALLLVLNFFLASVGASSALGAGSYFALLGIWMLLNVPLVFFGSYLASRNTPPEFPCRTNPIPRMIPDQPWYLRSLFGTFVTGILPFGVIFVQLFFVYTIIWQKQYYPMWGFGFFDFLLLLICSAETAVIMCFFHLCNEDYHWWWRSFIATGACGFYAFLFSIFYYFSRLDVSGFIPTLLYFSYSAIVCSGIAIVCGSVGFFASLTFVMKIYHGQQ